jgi:hypothetical protein
LILIASRLQGNVQQHPSSNHHCHKKGQSHDLEIEKTDEVIKGLLSQMASKDCLRPQASSGNIPVSVYC